MAENYQKYLKLPFVDRILQKIHNYSKARATFQHGGWRHQNPIMETFMAVRKIGIDEDLSEHGMGNQPIEYVHRFQRKWIYVYLLTGEWLKIRSDKRMRAKTKTVNGIIVPQNSKDYPPEVRKLWGE